MVVFVGVRMAMIVLSCSECNMTDSNGADFLHRQILDVCPLRGAIFFILVQFLGIFAKLTPL